MWPWLEQTTPHDSHAYYLSVVGGWQSASELQSVCVSALRGHECFSVMDIASKTMVSLLIAWHAGLTQYNKRHDATVTPTATSQHMPLCFFVWIVI